MEEQQQASPAFAPLRAQCWGTRGSVPSPGPNTTGYGGNTSCLEVKTGAGARYIFDAGSGIRPLGQRLGALEADLFLTHFHWDHIQGLPFFMPLYNPASRLRVHGARQGDTDIQTLIAGQMGPIYFPIPFQAVSADLRFHHLNGAAWESGDVRVRSMRVRHPGFTHGYRIESRGASIAYIPDNELFGGSYTLDQKATYADLVEFLGGVDLLFHDAMFTDAEYSGHEGWGHSTFTQAIQLAQDAGVKKLLLFHHAPERTDAELTQIVQELRDDSARHSSGLEIDIAAEGVELLVGGM